MSRRARLLCRSTHLICSALFVAACSGGGSVDQFSPTPQAHDISGTVTGLNGSLDLSLGDSSFELETNGPFSLTDAFPSGTDLTLTIEGTPVQQNCEITSPTSFSQQSDDVSGITIVCEDRNVVRVFVDDFDNGAFLAGVTVTASWDQGGAQSVEGVTSETGEVVFDIDEFDGRIVVSADLPGYGEQAQVVINTTTPSLHSVHLLMQQADLTTQFNANVGADLIVSGVTIVSIAPNALEDGAGNPYNGQVSAELTLVDPSSEPGVLPGDYLAIGAGQTESPVESYGGFQLSLTSTDGEPLQLISGQVAQINVPVATAAVAGAPASASIYYHDPATGYAQDEGTVTLQQVSGTWVFSGQVDHFSTYFSGTEYTPGSVTGCVVDVQGNPLPGVSVLAKGVNYIGTTRVLSDSSGDFEVPVHSGLRVLVTATDGYQSQTLEGTDGQNLTECLVASLLATTISLSWGENPSDLDTHFFGFSAVNAGDDFHVDWTDRSVTVEGIDIELDVDDVSSFGPEVVTVPAFPFEGVYRYAVHRFSGSSDIQASPARVSLNLGGASYLFAPPAGTPTDCWAIFDIRVDDDGAATLQVINSWQSGDYCTDGQFDRPS